MSRREQVRRRIADERGYVLVVVMALMVVAIAGAFALLASTLSAQQMTTRDTRVRSAQQAADAGLQATLYEQSETNLGSTYNDNGGVLGLSNFLDCDVPQVSVSGQITGIVSLNAGTGGVCPQGETGSGTATSNWEALGNHTYYEAESVPNETQFEHGSSGGSSSEDLEFPEFVAIGCSAATITDCQNNDSSPTAQYWREEVILQPVSPLQAIEGMGSVTINGLSALGINALVTVNGDVQTLGKLTTPLTVLGVNTALASSGLVPTFAASSFGGTVVSTAQTVTSTPCEAGDPTTNCIIQRQPVTLTNSTCTPCSTALGSDYNSTTHTFAMTSGTVNLTAGQYVLCNFNATGGTLNVQSGPVQIFIASPTSSLCSGNGYTEVSGSWNGGNFTAADGIDNTLTGTVNGIANLIDPSELQIYDLGDGGGYDNATSVSIGDTATCALKVLGVCTLANTPIAQEMVVYAPTSKVTMNTGACLVGVLGSCTVGAAGAFAGSIVGDTTSITASAITQDLDIGNFPLYTGVNAFRPVEYVQCDASVTKLTGTSSDLNGC
jgi:Tfp pilus assembly protein PilX